MITIRKVLSGGYEEWERTYKGNTDLIENTTS